MRLLRNDKMQLTVSSGQTKRRFFGILESGRKKQKTIGLNRRLPRNEAKQLTNNEI